MKELIDTLNDSYIEPTQIKNNKLAQDRYVQCNAIDVINTIKLLCDQLSTMDKSNLGEWQRLGLIAKKRDLERQLNYLSNYLNDESTMSKM